MLRGLNSFLLGLGAALSVAGAAEAVRVGIDSKARPAASIPSHPSDITDLPGLPPSLGHLRMRSGYIDVHPETGRKIFYWFVMSQSNPSKDPLVLWLTGGPGCSGVGGGLMSENGPFWATGGTGLEENVHSWTKVANVVYIDSPSNVGFSHSEAPSDNNVGDARTANDTYTFMQSFIDMHESPELPLRDLPFWITGESYGGHYVPNAAVRIAKGNAESPTSRLINLRGIQVGNAWTDAALNNKGCVIDWRGHTLISDATAEATLSSCDFASIGPLMATATATAAALDEKDAADPSACDAALNEVNAERGDINIYEIYAPLCDNRDANGDAIETQGTRLMREISRAGVQFSRVAERIAGAAGGLGSSSRRGDGGKAVTESGQPSPCVSNYVNQYLNDPAVQKAIHIDPLPYKWNMCSPTLNYSRVDLLTSVVPDYDFLYHNTNIAILVYSGDVDGIVSTTGDKLWINQFTSEKGIGIKAPFRPWMPDGLNVGGWRVIYNDGPKGARFMHSTVRGAGHLVPATQPERSYYLFTKVLNSEPLISGDEH